MRKKRHDRKGDELAKSLVRELQIKLETSERRVSQLEQKIPAQTKLQKHSYLFAEMPHSIRDPIYGNIPLSEAAFQTLNTRYFQRLKCLLQTGLTFHVYPGLQHSRFEHSVGVYHLMRLALQHLVLLNEVDLAPEHGILALCAALLHDIGHFPFSHILEEIQIDGRRLSHEQQSAYILNNDPELQQVLKKEWGINATDLVAVLQGNKADCPLFLHKLLNSTIDLDKMDYLRRDAYHAGVPYGDIDINWLISSFTVDPSDGALLVVDSGIGAVEQLIFAKYLMYRNIYWHHTTREVASMVKRAVVDLFLELGLDSLDLETNPKLQRLCQSTDAGFFLTMKEIAEKRELPPSTQELFQRLSLRHIYKRVHVIYASDGLEKEGEYRDARRRRAKEADICSAISKLPQWKHAKLRDWDILIDVATIANFPVDIKGVYFKDPPKEYALEGKHIVPWDKPKYVSCFDAKELENMEQAIRKIRYFFNPENPAGEQLRDLLRAYPELY